MKTSSSPVIFIFFLYTITAITLLTNYITYGHPAPSLKLCHGQQSGQVYHYKYQTLMLLNNNDHKGHDPVGFGYTSHFSLQNVWEDSSSNFILRVTLTGPASGGHFTTRSGEERRGPGPTIYRKANELVPEDSYPFYAHVVDTVDGQSVKSFFVHNRETTTRANLKKAVILLSRTKPTPQEKEKNVSWHRDGQEIRKSAKWTNVGPDSSVLVPEIFDEWYSETIVGRDHALVVSSKGSQNVTYKSRVYNEAYSKLYSSYNLKLVSEEKDSDKSPLTGAKSLSDAISAIGDDFIQEQDNLGREKHVCHDCRSLVGLTKDYSKHMSDDKVASVQAAIAFLRLLERVRSGGPGTSKEDILKVLRELFDTKQFDVLASTFDVLAGARTEQSVSAALEFLNLPYNDDLDLSERFLSSLAASCVTSAAAIGHQSATTESDSSHEYIVEELLQIIGEPQWRSSKLKTSTLLALGTALKTTNLVTNGNQQKKIDDLNKAVIKAINAGIRECNKDTDCTVARLHALGNAAVLELSINVIEKHALDHRLRRESVAAMKAIRDSLQSEVGLQRKELDAKLIHRLRLLVGKVAFEDQQESTSRIIAAEIISHYLEDDHLSGHLIRSLKNFANTEMATLVWNRALKKAHQDLAPSSINNWHTHSTKFNGSSASYSRSMSGTKTMNATYTATIELTKGKLLKESSFDFALGNENKSENILSVGLFARGLNSFASSSDSDEGDSDESAMAGMSLKVLGVQLRPYVFFSGTGELMGHVWSGTASNGMNAYRANLLIADHDEAYPLINGFLVEQKLKGVLSLDLSGEIQVSLWNRNSHAVVSTKAGILMQGSQTILTSDVTTMAAQQFTFGGETSVDTTTDTDFYSSPFKMCVELTQPAFIVRHNTRKFEQVDSDKMHRRVHKMNYNIGAKSYALHKDNNEMCAAMKT